MRAGASAIGALVDELEAMLPDLPPVIAREEAPVDYVKLATAHNKRTKK